MNVGIIIQTSTTQSRLKSLRYRRCISMADPGRPHSNFLHTYSLPSLSSFSGAASRMDEYNEQLRQTSVTGTRSDNIHHALQHEITVRDNTISTLQTELSRVQSICSQLETKSKVMDRELAAMVEERADLRRASDEISAQFEKLIEEKNVLQAQSQADAAQWRQIMSMSSKLQLRNIDESRRFQAEREAWTAERHRLEQRIASSQQYHCLQRPDSANFREATVSEPSNPRRLLTLNLSTISQDRPRNEMSLLCNRCQELEDLFTAIPNETSNVERISVVLRDAGCRLMPISTHDTSTATTFWGSERH